MPCQKTTKNGIKPSHKIHTIYTISLKSTNSSTRQKNSIYNFSEFFFSLSWLKETFPQQGILRKLAQSAPSLIFLFVNLVSEKQHFSNILLKSMDIDIRLTAGPPKLQSLVGESKTVTRDCCNVMNTMLPLLWNH